MRFIFFLFLFINKFNFINSIPIELFNDNNFTKKIIVNRYQNMNFGEIYNYDNKDKIFGKKIKNNITPFQIPYCIYINPNDTHITNLECGLRHLTFIYISI